MKINFPLLALATGAFGIGITEFAPMGLLPDMAEGLGVSIPAAGLLVSAYALGVMLGAPLMTLTTARMNRRTLLIGLMAKNGILVKTAALGGSDGFNVARPTVLGHRLEGDGATAIPSGVARGFEIWWGGANAMPTANTFR